MEKSVLFTQNQKWDSNLDCEFQVSVQAANKWHIMNNLGRSLTVLAVPWILSAALLSATLALVYKHYWHFGIPNFYFFFILLLPLQDVSCFCEGLAHLHSPILTDAAHLFPQLGNNIPQCGSLKIWRFICCCQSCLVPCSGLEMWYPVSPFFCLCFLISKRHGTC